MPDLTGVGPAPPSDSTTPFGRSGADTTTSLVVRCDTGALALTAPIFDVGVSDDPAASAAAATASVPCPPVLGLGRGMPDAMRAPPSDADGCGPRCTSDLVRAEALATGSSREA